MSNQIEELKEEFKVSTSKITDSIGSLDRTVAGMDKSIKNIEKTMDGHDKRITEAREGQLLATSGLVVADRDIKQIKIATQKDRDHVASEFKELRGEQTGQFDVPPRAIMATEKKTNSTMIAGMFKTFGPWMVAAMILLGAYLGSGGDEERVLQVLQNLREIGLKVEQIEKAQTAPILVPTPVSEEYASEDIPQ